MVDADEAHPSGPKEEGGTRPPRPYADAPRLPEGEEVDVTKLVSGSTVELEIGPGRGGFLFERAAAAPEVGLLGLEVRRKWAHIVDRRLAERGLSARARVFAEDAKHALARLGPNGVLARVFVHFPDPWWKKRHAKRMLIDGESLTQIERLLMADGELFLQTDVPDRAARLQALASAHPGFRPAGDSAGSPLLEQNPYGARSPRERRAMRDGLPIYRLRFRTPKR